MALSSDKKLYIALGVLAVLGSALYVQNQGRKEEARAHTYEGRNADLPRLELSEEQAEKITKIVIEQPAESEETEGVASRHVLVKEGDTWSLSEPVQAAANQTNVDSLLKNLPKLGIQERISREPSSYEQYDLTDEKAVRVQAFEGEKQVLDLRLGKSGGRGQTVRLAEVEGVYSLSGYSSYLYTRDTKSWRDLRVLQFEEEKATRIDIENEKGSFAFKKEGEQWKAEWKKGKSPVATSIKDFDSGRVVELLRAYKGLNAADFPTDKTLESAGLEKPQARLIITLESGEKHELLLGGTAEGSSRFARKADSEQIFTLSSWAADWALADDSKFKKQEEPSSPAPSLDAHEGHAH